MRQNALNDRSSALPPVSPDKSFSRTGQTRNNRKLNTRSTAQGRNGATSKENAGTKSTRFGSLPLQQARVLQQLQTLSISSTLAAPADKVPSARVIKQFVPKRKPALVKQPKLRRTKVDPAGNTDSEVDSPLSQPVIRNQHSTEANSPRQPKASQSVPDIPDACICADELPAVCSPAPSLLQNLSIGSESASAVTPSRTTPPALPDCVTDTPESMALSTPACGQALLSSGTSSAVPMSCSTTGIQSANLLRNGAVPGLGSPMCMSPDTWATPHQLQWEPSSNSLSAAQDSPQLPAKAPTPSASQLHLANLQFGLDAIKDAAAAETAAAGAHRRSRLASSSTMADYLPGLSETDTNSERDLDGSALLPTARQQGRSGCARRGLQSSDRGFGGFAGEAEWMEDLEVTPTPSQETSPGPSGDADSPQTELQLDLESDDDGPHQVHTRLGFQVMIIDCLCQSSNSHSQTSSLPSCIRRHVLCLFASVPAAMRVCVYATESAYVVCNKAAAHYLHSCAK